MPPVRGDPCRPGRFFPLALCLRARVPGPWLQDRAKGQASALTKVETKGVKNQEQSRSSKVRFSRCRVRLSRTAYAGTDMYLWCKQLPVPSSRARISTSRRDRSILPPGRGFSAVPEIGPLYHSCCAHPAAPALHTWNLVTLQLCHFPILPPVFPDFLFRLRGLGIVHRDEVVPSQYQCSPPHGVTDDNIGVLQPGTPHAAFIAHKT